ncbi:MAG: COX15/CtaA family protein [Pirellulales bacterium]|nr:COX15/CtaA family protein [Pirellulales bacterium]
MTLIFVGGLVTTTESGMAVPDWPTTFGYGMFSFPVNQWLGNGWELFIEHGHRLLGSTVGIITIIYLLALFRWDKRRWMWTLGVLTLAAVIFQGILGGTRVIENARTLAMVHGCFAPVFLSLCISNAVFTSRRWGQAFTADCIAAAKEKRRVLASPLPSAQGNAFVFAVCALVGVAYLQIILGAQLRHLPADASAVMGFNLAIWHIVIAATLILLAVGVGIAARRIYRAVDNSARKEGRHMAGVRKSAHWVSLLLFVQILLGCGTWLLNYGWPSWFAGTEAAERFVIVSQDFWQTFVTTTHQTAGSLILASCVAMLWRAVAANSGLLNDLAKDRPRRSLAKYTATGMAPSPLVNGGAS